MSIHLNKFIKQINEKNQAAEKSLDTLEEGVINTIKKKLEKVRIFPKSGELSSRESVQSRRIVKKLDAKRKSLSTDPGTHEELEAAVKTSLDRYYVKYNADKAARLKKRFDWKLAKNPDQPDSIKNKARADTIYNTLKTRLDNHPQTKKDQLSDKALKRITSVMAPNLGPKGPMKFKSGK